MGASSSTFIKADELTETALRNLTEGRGVDLAIEASGSPDAVRQALSAVRKGGTLLQVGIPAGLVPLPLGRVVPREVTIVTTNGMVCEVDLPLALALLSQTDLAAQITDRIIPLDSLVPEGLEPLSLHGVLGKDLVHIQAKAATHSFAKMLVRELASFGIRVNVVAPGTTRTSLVKVLTEQRAREFDTNLRSAEQMELAQRGVPLARLGEPWEVAKAVLYLSTASFCTATILNISGGNVRAVMC